MKTSVSITGKERLYLANSSRSYLLRECDNDAVGSKPFNQVLALHPNNVEASNLIALTQYIRDMNKVYKRMIRK